MNTNILISLDTRRQKKNGLYPLIMRIGHNERTASIPLSVDLAEIDWDNQARLVKKSYSGVSTVTRLNNLIQKKKSEAMDVILALHEGNKLSSLSITDLRSKIINKNNPQTFFAFTQVLIDELIASNRVGTAKSYKGIASVVRKFWGNETLRFSDINYNFLSKLENYHLSKGNSQNGLAVYLRTIRAIYNKAIKSGLIDKDIYPFETYKVRSTPTEKRALDWGYLKLIINLNLAPGHPLHHARNYFLASYMMYGMNFTDMAFLKAGNIQDGRILYRRRKTSKQYDIKITPALAEILKYYQEAYPQAEFVFPILKRDNVADQYKDIMWARKRYNTKLGLLALECKFDKKLTSYVSRHSFATQAMLKNVPLNAISSMLGHSSLKTTEIYLKSLPSNILDEYNSIILQEG